MKKYLITALLTILVASAFLLLPRVVLAVVAAVLLLGFTGLYVAGRYAQPLLADFRTSDNTIKTLIGLGLLDSAGFGFVETLTETHLASSFTDGGGAAGTKQFTGYVPKGALLLGSKVVPTVGFTGDTTAALIIGDGSDTDRYNTSTIDIFTAAAAGVQSGIPSGNKLLTAANRPTMTVTSSADFTLLLTTGGSVTVSLYYIRTA